MRFNREFRGIIKVQITEVEIAEEGKLNEL